MARLHDFLARHRRFVLIAWLLLLVGAAPFAMRQTEHLTSGGFLVPGSGSEKVDEALADFEGAQRETLAVVLAQRDLDRSGRRAIELDQVPEPAHDATVRGHEQGVLELRRQPAERAKAVKVKAVPPAKILRLSSISIAASR